MNDLNAKLLAAHATDDLAALVTLYAKAAQIAPDTQAKQFFLTHAYVFALEQDHPDAPTLRDRLNTPP